MVLNTVDILTSCMPTCSPQSRHHLSASKSSLLCDAHISHPSALLGNDVEQDLQVALA